MLLYKPDFTIVKRRAVKALKCRKTERKCLKGFADMRWFTVIEFVAWHSSFPQDQRDTLVLQYLFFQHALFCRYPCRLVPWKTSFLHYSTSCVCRLCTPERGFDAYFFGLCPERICLSSFCRCFQQSFFCSAVYHLQI